MTQPPPVPGEQPDGAEDAVSLRDRLNDRRILAAIAGAVVVVAALGFFVVKPMLSGSSNSADDAPVVHHAVTHRPSATPSPSATAPEVAATPAPQLKVRDPFSPLVVPAAATAAASAPATTPASAPPNIVIVQPSSAPAAPTYTLKLVSISASATDASQDTASVLFNGAPMTLKLGQNFPSATNGPFQLTFVSSVSNPKYNSAEFAYGDQTFSLAIGQTQTES